MYWQYDHQKTFFFSFCFQSGATSHAVVLRAFHASIYRRSQTNLNVKKHTDTHKTAWYAAKTRFPYSLSLMSGRCSSPTLDEGLCSSHSKPPSFPTLSSPSTCQSEIMIEPGWQAVNRQPWKRGLSVPPPFQGPLPPEVFPPHAPCGLPHTPTKTAPVQFCVCPKLEVTSNIIHLKEVNVSKNPMMPWGLALSTLWA